jgi:hypothetical protein
MRLDPHPPPLFWFFLGLSQYYLQQYNDAAASLEIATRLNPGDQYSFLMLGAAYGHLGRKREGFVAVSRYNDLEVGQGGAPLTLDFVPMPELNCCVYPTPREETIFDGLRLSGVPGSLDVGDFAVQNRLSDVEIRSLMFGHLLHGRSLRTGDERTASLTKDGLATMSGDWVLGNLPLTDGTTQFKGNKLCIRFGPASYCGTVFRNPGGTKAKENEFIWYSGTAFTFSQVE